MPRKKKSITVKQIAQAARVSVGTVSRVLNGNHTVGELIRQRVLRSSERLGYRHSEVSTPPHAVLRPGGVIGVVFFGMDDAFAQTQLMSMALHGIEQYVSHLGQNLMLANIPKGDRPPTFLSHSKVTGLIIKGPNQGVFPDPSPFLSRLYDFPRVWLMGQLPTAKGDHCNSDLKAAGRLAAEHAFEMGHTKLGFLNAKPGQIQWEAIKRGFVEAIGSSRGTLSLFESATALPMAWPLPAIPDESRVFALTSEWAAMTPESRPTLLFVPSDRTAQQLYTALSALGLKPGRDVSIISCNNESSIISGLSPGLTSVDLCAEAVGRLAVEQLLWRIQRQNTVPLVQLLVEPNLVVRNSVVRLHSP